MLRLDKTNDSEVFQFLFVFALRDVQSRMDKGDEGRAVGCSHTESQTIISADARRA